MADNEEKNTFLVERDNLDVTIKSIIEKEESIIRDANTVMPLLAADDLKKSLVKRKTQAEARVQALKAGFIPIEAGWTTSITSKSKWDKRYLKQTFEEMPQEVKDALERVKDLGIFKRLGVQGRQGGDPILVGRAGGTDFLIAAWLTLRGAKPIVIISSAVPK